MTVVLDSNVLNWRPAGRGEGAFRRRDLSPARSRATSTPAAKPLNIASTDGSIPPQLRTAGALEACRRSLVGEGRFSAKVLVPQQTPFPSLGKIVAFNGRWHGRPGILAHVYGAEPVPTSYTLPFVIGAVGHGTYGTTLSASLPRFTGKWGYVTAISLSLGRRYSSHGRSHSYLTAACPAPDGFGGASFALSRARLSFAGRKPMEQTLTRSCKVRGKG